MFSGALAEELICLRRRVKTELCRLCRVEVNRVELRLIYYQHWSCHQAELESTYCEGGVDILAQLELTGYISKTVQLIYRCIIMV